MLAFGIGRPHLASTGAQLPVTPCRQSDFHDHSEALLTPTKPTGHAALWHSRRSTTPSTGSSPTTIGRRPAPCTRRQERRPKAFHHVVALEAARASRASANRVTPWQSLSPLLSPKQRSCRPGPHGRAARTPGPPALGNVFRHARRVRRGPIGIVRCVPHETSRLFVAAVVDADAMPGEDRTRTGRVPLRARPPRASDAGH